MSRHIKTPMNASRSRTVIHDRNLIRRNTSHSPCCYRRRPGSLVPPASGVVAELENRAGIRERADLPALRVQRLAEAVVVRDDVEGAAIGSGREVAIPIGGSEELLIVPDRRAAVRAELHA